MKKFLLLGALILLTGIVINYSLGGFKQVEPALISNNTITVYGFLYEGGHSSESLDNHLTYLRKLLNDSTLLGTLTIINYVQPELEKRGMIKQFVGIEKKNGDVKEKLNLDSLTIQAYNGIQFRIPIKPLVMPSPEKLKKLAIGAAESMDNELQGFSIEQYVDKLLIINFPLK